MRLFMVCDASGNTLADQLRDGMAKPVAQVIANRRGSPVWLYDRSLSATSEGKEVKPRAAELSRGFSRVGRLVPYASEAKS